jgi:hypothetical protein
MKNLFVASLLFLLTPLLFAQNPLKGSIKYDIKYAVAEKDKAQMEQFGFSMPTGMLISSNGTQARMKMLTAKGVFTEFLSTKNEVYLMDKVDKIAYKMPKAENKEGEQQQEWIVTKTEEFETIIGKKCRKYIVETKDKKSKQLIWATPEYKFSNTLFDNVNMKSGGQASFYDKIEGIPLKMVIEGGQKMEMKAVSLSTTAPAEAELKLPADYSVEEFSYMAIGKMMMRGGN